MIVIGAGARHRQARGRGRRRHRASAERRRQDHRRREPAALPARRRGDSGRSVRAARAASSAIRSELGSMSRMDNPLVQPDPGLFIWTILTFLVLLGAAREVRLAAAAAGAREPSGVDPEVARRRAAGEAGARAAARRSRPQIIRQARVEADAIISQSRADAERLREEMKQKARGRGRRDRPQRRAPDPARDRPRAAADPPRGGRPVGDDRVEADPAQSLEGRQRAADRRGAQAGRRAAALIRGAGGLASPPAPTAVQIRTPDFHPTNILN